MILSLFCVFAKSCDTQMCRKSRYTECRVFVCLRAREKEETVCHSVCVCVPSMHVCVCVCVCVCVVCRVVARNMHTCSYTMFTFHRHVYDRGKTCRFYSWSRPQVIIADLKILLGRDLVMLGMLCLFFLCVKVYWLNQNLYNYALYWHILLYVERHVIEALSLTQLL